MAGRRPIGWGSERMGWSCLRQLQWVPFGFDPACDGGRCGGIWTARRRDARLLQNPVLDGDDDRGFLFGSRRVPSFLPSLAFEIFEAGNVELASGLAGDRMRVDQRRPELDRHGQAQREKAGVSNQRGTVFRTRFAGDEDIRKSGFARRPGSVSELPSRRMPAPMPSRSQPASPRLPDCRAVGYHLAAWHAIANKADRAGACACRLRSIPLQAHPHE